MKLKELVGNRKTKQLDYTTEDMIFILNNVTNIIINIAIVNIADDKLDDMMSKIPSIYHDAIQTIVDKVVDYADKTEYDVNMYFDKSPKHTTKEFMVWVTNNCPKSIQGYIRRKYLNQSYNVLKKPPHNHYKRYKNLNIKGDDFINEQTHINNVSWFTCFR